MSTLRFWFQAKWKWLLFWFGLILIVSLSFGLGYLAAKQANPAPIIIEKNSVQ